MSNEVEHKKHKKSKKSKKDDGELQDAVGQNTDTAGTSNVELDEDKAERKRRKKEKKAREKAENAGEPMQVDEVADGEKKKRKREAEAEQAGVDQPEAATSVKEKKKKHKKSSEAETTAPEAPEDSKEKKKRKQNVEQSSSSTPSTTSKADAEAFLAKHSITITIPPKSNLSVTPYVSFDNLDIPEKLRASFTGFKEPTPIQACTWPPAMQGSDVVGIAETGSGKTLAFGIPALSRLITASPPSKSASSTVNVLVVAPTRELAIQTHDTLSALGAPFGIASVAVFGGVPKDPQVKMLANAGPKKGLTTRIIVGTPGRILDLINDGACDLSCVDYLVLDEADRMLDKGFENDIRQIISHTKQGKERQTMMFSATWPEAVRRLASTFQQDPVRVTVGSDDLTANSRVEQIVEVFDDARSKDTKLLQHLRSLSHKKTTLTGSAEARILVFALYKKEASRVEQMLRRQGYSVGALHGDMSQGARMDALEAFKNGSTGLLVATDVAARGLDIPNVGAVINYTFPLTIEDYIHRIGRTGRGGKSGKSITFFTGENHERSLAGELARVLRESGFECQELKDKFPMTIKKKTHSVYGAFFREDVGEPKTATRIVF